MEQRYQCTNVPQHLMAAMPQSIKTAAGSTNPRLFSQRRRTPPHPGAFLESRFLKPLKVSQETLAQGLGVSRRRVNELIRGHRAITPDTAIRLGGYFGTGPEFWLNLQQAWHLYQAWRSLRYGSADPPDEQ
jgi:addiction module HigA family antidote